MRKLEIIKNVGSSWFSLGVNIVVGILLSPLILHRLGNTAYGAWVLAFSITGYYGLLDLGIRSSVIRYVSTYSASNDRAGLEKLISTSLFLYTAIGAAALVATLALSASAGFLFHIPADFVPTARLLFLIVGGGVAVGFPVGLFGGVLEGMGRFYVVNVTNLAATLVRAALIVLALRHGYGLQMVALVTVLIPLLASLVRASVALRMLDVKLRWRFADRGALREIWRYSAASFALMVAYKLRFKTDELVISAMLPIAAVTFFSVGDRLVDYTMEVVGSLAQIFVPMSGQADARGDSAELRRIFIAGNRACAMVVLPISATLIILGRQVITAWVGPSYVAPSYPVMLVLLIPFTVVLAQAASTRILYGMAEHRTLAWISSLEAVANVLLSVVLIRPLGILGDALGTAIPLALTGLYFLPRHLCRLLGVRVGTFLREAYTLPVVLIAPTVVALLLAKRWFFAHTYWQVGLQIFLGLSPYGLGMAWAYRSGRLLRVRNSSALPDAVDAALIEGFQEEGR